MCLLLLRNQRWYPRFGSRTGPRGAKSRLVPRAAHRVAATHPATTPEGTTATARALEGAGSRALCLIDFFGCP